jgi:hypothetical protein
MASELDATSAVPTLRVSSLAFAVAALMTGGTTVTTHVVRPVRPPCAIGDQRQAVVEIPVGSGGVMRKARRLFARMQLLVTALAVMSMSHATSSWLRRSAAAASG